MSRFPVMKLTLLVCAALVIALAWQNRQLQQENSVLQQKIVEPYAGMWVPVLNAEALNGSSVSVGKPNKAFQVLFFFSPTCDYCRISLPAVKRLNAHINTMSNTRLIGISHASESETRNYAQQHQLDFAVIYSTDRRALSLFRARLVPLLLVVDSNGRVRHSHKGTLSAQEQVDAILAALRNKEVQKVANI